MVAELRPAIRQRAVLHIEFSDPRKRRGFVLLADPTIEQNVQQVRSLLCTTGNAHRIDLAIRAERDAEFEDCWFVGVEVGHARHLRRRWRNGESAS